MAEAEDDARHAPLPSEEIRRRLIEKAELAESLRAARPAERRISGEGSALEDGTPAPRPLHLVESAPESVSGLGEAIAFANLDPMTVAQLAEDAKTAEVVAAQLRVASQDATDRAQTARRAFFSYMQRAE